MTVKLSIENPHLMTREEKLKELKLLLNEALCWLCDTEDMDDADDIITDAHRAITKLYRAEHAAKEV